MKKYLSLVAVSFLALGVNNANAAEATGIGHASATILAETGITENQQMNFGQMLSKQAHNVTVSTSGVRSGTDSVLIGGTTNTDIKQGLFTITGVNGQKVTVKVDKSFTINNGATTLTVNNVQMKLGTGGDVAAGSGVDGTITGTSLALAVGGTLEVTQNAPAGTYSGTYNVTVTY